MTSKSWAALSLVVAAALVSCGSASSHVRSQGIALPESRVTTRPIHQRQTKTVDEVLSPTSDSAEKATTSFRGGASALPAKAIYGVIVMALIEAGLKKFFALTNIKFPSQLGGCMFLFVVAVVAQMIHPGWGDSIQAYLEPGCALMNKWLPSFFVPGLAMLPLAPSIGSGKEIAKAFGVVALGLLYSLSTISFSVLALRKAQGATNEAPVVKAAPTPAKKQPKRNTKAPAPPPSPPKPFSDETKQFLTIGSIVSYIACVAALRMDLPFSTPIQTAALLLSTLAGFVWAVGLPASFNKVVHPLITSSATTLLMVELIALGVGTDIKEVLKSYKVGSLNPLKMGAGDVLLWLLGPSVVSFAVSMYSRKQLIYENFLVIVTAMIVASVGGLYGTAAFVRAINLGGSSGKLVRLSILGRNVTTALSLVIASILGGDISIAAVFVVCTGVLGATYGKPLMKMMGIYDPVTRGLGMGGASQGLGVAAMSDEPDAFPFAAIGMVLTAVCATTLVSIPASRDALINLATGGITPASVPVPPIP